MRQFYSKDCEPTPDSHVERDHAIGRAKPGDILVIPSVDHLARRWPDLESILTLLADRGVTIAVRRSSRQRGEPISVWAKRDLRTSAYDRAARSGVYRKCTGRRPKSDRALAVKLAQAGIATEMIATVLNVNPRTVFRYLARQAEASITQ